MKTVKRYWLYWFSVSVLTLSYGYNTFHAVEDTIFERFNIDMEAHILGRLALNNDQGFLAEGGFTGYDPCIKDDCYWDGYQYEKYYNQASVSPDYVAYQSQQGGQAMLFSAIDQLLPFSKNSNFHILKFLTAFISALVLSGFVLWSKNNFGIVSSLVVLMLSALSYWLVIFSANLWWFFGNFLLQFIWVINYLDKNDRNQGKVWIIVYFITFISTLIKCFFSGFEYISTFLVMGMMPYIYYLFLDGVSLKKSIVKLLKGSVASLVGTLTGLIFLSIQIGVYKGAFKYGIEHIKFSFLKRTSNIGEDIDPGYLKSLNSSYSEVFNQYWNKPIIDISEIINVESCTLVFWQALLIFAIISVILFYAEKQNRKIRAILVVFYMSLLAPLSWFVIFKAHSYVHDHMNMIVWFMPTFLLGYVLVSITFVKLFSLIESIK